jgi:hypothetical protein
MSLGKTDPRYLALLQDRTRSVMGEEQLFGTFMLRQDNAPLFLYPAPAEADLNRVRTRIGLPTIGADLSRSDEPLLPCRNVRRCAEGSGLVPPRQAFSAQAWRTLPDAAAPVYLAGPAEKRQELRELGASLPSPLHNMARWLEWSPGLCAVTQFDAGPAARTALAQARLADIRQSRLMIVVEGEEPDALTRTEIGAALAADVPVLRVGKHEDPLDAHPAVVVVPDVAGAAEAAQDWAHR